MFNLYLDSVQHFRREDVHPRVDLVRNKLLRLLDKALDLSRVLVVDHHAVLARLVNLGNLEKTFKPYLIELITQLTTSVPSRPWLL